MSELISSRTQLVWSHFATLDLNICYYVDTAILWRGLLVKYSSYTLNVKHLQMYKFRQLNSLKNTKTLVFIMHKLYLSLNWTSNSDICLSLFSCRSVGFLLLTMARSLCLSWSSKWRLWHWGHSHSSVRRNRSTPNLPCNRSHPSHVTSVQQYLVLSYIGQLCAWLTLLYKYGHVCGWRWYYTVFKLNKMSQF